MYKHLAFQLASRCSNQILIPPCVVLWYHDRRGSRSSQHPTENFSRSAEVFSNKHCDNVTISVTLTSVRPNDSSRAQFKLSSARLSALHIILSLIIYIFIQKNHKLVKSRVFQAAEHTQTCSMEFKLLRFSSRHCKPFKMQISFTVQVKNPNWSSSCLK